MTVTTNVDMKELDSLQATLREKVLSGEITLDQLRAFMEPEVDEPVQTPTSILRRILTKPLLIAATDGTQIIPKAASVFTGWIDSDFRSWGADEASESMPELQTELYEMAQDATFQQMFGSLTGDTERLCMTQSQIIAFVKTHRDYLRADGYATFFLFKSNGKFFVADVFFLGDGRLEVYVYLFEDDSVWGAEFRYRVVVPQL